MLQEHQNGCSPARCDQLEIIPIFMLLLEGYLKLLNKHWPAAVQQTEVKYAAREAKLAWLHSQCSRRTKKGK